MKAKNHPADPHPKELKQMKRTLSILLTLALFLTGGLSSALADTVRPLEITEDSYDLANGEFWVNIDPLDPPVSGPLTLALYLEDRYSLAEIENLQPGDTIEVQGKTYTVDLMVIHGWYDSDGDGEYDTGTTTVKNPDQVKDLLEKYELEITDRELYPDSYEIITREEFDGYIAFTVGGNGFCHPLINDVTFRTSIGTAEIPLPLPESFACHIRDEFGGDDIPDGTAQDFLNALEYGCDRYSDTVRFEDGKLVEAWLCR